MFLLHFLKLVQDQSFQPWHWCWPGQHQPLHSMLALISELEDSPEDSLANENRQLVDLGLSMCEISNGDGIASFEGDCVDTRLLSSGGIEAWKLIRKTRDEVWEKSGLDSNILYCPESAEDIEFDAGQVENTFPHLNAYPASNATIIPSGADTSWPTLPVTTVAFWPDYSMVEFAAVIPGSF